MDRERAETFLRLLVEAELRDLSPPPPLHAGGATARLLLPARTPSPTGAMLH